MARPIYDAGDIIQRYRAVIRPAMVGNIGRVEPALAASSAVLLYNWLQDIVDDALRTSGLSSPTGRMRKQLKGGVRVTGRSSLRTMAGRIWTQPWVFPHEYGATITPKKAPWLAVPFAYALHPDGRPKFKSPGAWRRYGSFIKKNADGRRFIVYKSGDTIKYLYVLVDQTEIPARLGLNKLGNERLGMLLADLGQLFIRETLPLLQLDRMQGARL